MCSELQSAGFRLMKRLFQDSRFRTDPEFVTRSRHVFPTTRLTNSRVAEIRESPRRGGEKKKEGVGNGYRVSFCASPRLCDELIGLTEMSEQIMNQQGFFDEIPAVRFERMN